MPESPQPSIIFLAFAREDIPLHQDLPRLPDEQKQLRALVDPAVLVGRYSLLPEDSRGQALPLRAPGRVLGGADGAEFGRS